MIYIFCDHVKICQRLINDITCKLDAYRNHLKQILPDNKNNN